MRTGLSRFRIAILAIAAAVALTVSLSASPDRAHATTIGLQQVAMGLSGPIGIVNAADGSDRLFIIEQSGRIRVITSGGTLLPTPFLDVSSIVKTSTEEGLLGLAFHPDYETNGLFYVDYVNLAGDIVIARYQVSGGDPNVADAGSAFPMLTISHPFFGNHNGGQLQFGPDGYLYISVGDGGGGGDTANNAQNLEVLLGKILRLDVDSASPYGIPPDNPLVGVAGLDEIWAYGLRNPWRFTFDRLTGDIFIGDVGQNNIEEIDFQPAGSTALRNYGWRLMEGSTCFNPPSMCNPGGLILPILEYDHSFGCSVTGGYRYRGASPLLAGTYLYADYCSGRVWGATLSGTWSTTELLDTTYFISTFGEDEDGDVYLADAVGGRIYRIDAMDGDNDGIADSVDNCPSNANPGQENADANFIDLSPPKVFDDVTLANSDNAGDECDTDDDNDGRSDADEASGAGCGGIITDSLLRDTDGDRALDGAECVLGTNPLSTMSAPSLAACGFFGAGDADGDGVLDSREFCYYNTSNASLNTDGDGCGDGREVASINADTQVNVLDLAAIAQHQGTYASPGAAHLVNFDTTKNGTIDVIDLQTVAARNGNCP
jgi:glucose/arabinose dehydrogenase